MIIDTHTHLDSHDYASDVDEVINRAFNAGIKRMIIPGASPKTLPRAIWLAEQYKEIYFASGVHPYDIDELADISNFSLLALEHPKCVAIGECGLDYYRKVDETAKSAQKEVFHRHCKIAAERSLPIILHVREANEDVAKILREYPDLTGVFHCYNASALLLEFSDRFYYGIGGVCTFKNARALVEILPRIPKERLLIETDSPYLSPHPHRGERNESAKCVLIVDKIAEILGTSASEIAQISTKNARNLFKGLE